MAYCLPALRSRRVVPSQYTCDRAGISPPLTWCGLPDGTESLVLGVEYPGAGDFNEARNDLCKAGYGGPYPPNGHGRYRYHFRLLAISQPTVDLKPTATGADVLRTAQPYAIQRAELVLAITADRRYHGHC